MQAAMGDKIVVRGHHAGQPDREAVILTVEGANGVPPYSGAGPTAVRATNVNVVSPTEITAVTGGGAKAGTFSLYVITPGGTSAANIGDNFTY